MRKSPAQSPPQVCEFRFGFKKTKCGVTVTITTPAGRVQKKRFRNGYASAHTSAKRWIEDRIAEIRDHEDVDDCQKAVVIIE